MPHRRIVLAAASFVMLATAPRALHAQVMALQQNFMPPVRMMQGFSGGPMAASNFDSSCRGNIPPRPQHHIVTGTGFQMLHVFVQSSGDNTMMIRGPNGQIWCNDDTYGLNPAIDLQMVPPGRYEIFVGAYSSGQSYPYQIYVTQNPMVNPDNVGQFMAGPPGPTMIQGGPSNVQNGPMNVGPTIGPAMGPNVGPNVQPPPSAGPLDSTQRPLFGTLDIRGPMRANRTAMGSTQNATQDASSVQGQGTCRGYVNAAPSYVLRLNQPQPFLRLFVNSAADTTMLIQRPDGSFQCDDDSGGHLQPMLDGSFDAGTYFVWVGIYRAGMGHPFRLTITNDSNAHP